MKKIIYKILWGISKFIGLGFGGIFFSKEIKDMDKEFDQKIK